MKHTIILTLVAVLILAGCATNNAPKPEKGPDGTIAYMVPVESNEPGTKVDVNGEYVGTTPFTLKIFGNKNGTFHFGHGLYHFTVVATPPKPGLQPQTKVFLTGGYMRRRDTIPTKISFLFAEGLPVPAAQGR